MSPHGAAVVFLGPSLSRDAALAILPTADIRPPARRGDLDMLDTGICSEVVLIDGVMVYDHPPSPSEVWRLLDRGIRVSGAASLGALRAVELRGLGMRGSGWIFEAYRSGRVMADDELVARLDPRTGCAETVFLINVRYAAERLVSEGRLDSAQAARLLGDLSALYFEDRISAEVSRTAKACGIEPGIAADLLSPMFDIKASDAAACLSLVARGAVGQQAAR
jgi:hypothetical protein